MRVLGLQFFALLEKIKSLRVGESFNIFNRASVNDVTNRKLGNLTGLSARNVANLNNARGYVSGRTIGADLSLNFFDQVVIQLTFTR